MLRAVIRPPGDGERVAGPWGRSYLVKARTSDTAGAYSLVEIIVPAGSPWSTHHIHSPAEAWYVIDGQLTFRLGDAIFDAKAGSFVLAPGDLPHSMVNSGSTAARYLVFFSPPGLEQWYVDFAALIEAARSGEPSREEVDALAARYGIVPVGSP
jgi:mannose-6-phosphate isomerase-like protein (cupin superfamily)